MPLPWCLLLASLFLCVLAYCIVAMNTDLITKRAMYVKEAKKTVDGAVPANFWDTVDASLKTLRAEKSDDAIRISK